MLKKKWLMSVLLILLIGALAACTSPGANNTTPSAPAAQTGTDTSKAEASGDTADPYAFPLTAPVELNIFAVRNANVTKNFGELQMFHKLREQSNVTVHWKNATAGEEATQQKNLLIASNELPDAFYGAWIFTESELIKYGTDGTLIPLEDLIDEYAPNLLKVFEQRPELRQKLTAPDGHIYALPMLQEDPHVNMPNAMLINRTWLDNLGLAMPTTTEELRDVLIAFKNDDPNRNGQADEIPLTFMGSHHILGFPGFSGVFGKVGITSPQQLHVENGKVEFAPISEEFKQFLIYMHELYQQGLIDPEVFTHDRNVYYSKFKSPERIIGAGFAWSPFGINDVPDEEGDYVMLPPLRAPGGKDPEWLLWEPTHSLGAFAITRVNQHPEITMKWIDQVYDPLTSFEMMQGPENVTFKQLDSGRYELIDPPNGVGALAFQHAEAPGAHFVGAVLKEFRAQVEAAPIIQSKIDAVDIMLPYAPEEIFPSLIMTDEDTSQLTDLNMMVTTHLNSWVAKFMINGNVEQEWDAYVKLFEQAGLEHALEIYQRYYDNFSN